MNDNPRKVRGYKIQDKPYLKAMRRAKKEKLSLATLIEEAVIRYAEGEAKLIIHTKK